MSSSDPQLPPVDVAREERFLQLFLASERRIHAFILSLVPNWNDADDLLQETSAVVWRRLDEFQSGTDFVAWALSIARYQVLNYRKKKLAHHTRFSDTAFEALAADIATASEGSDARRDALEHCLSKLRPDDRELIRLRYQPDATTQAVAERLGRALKTVYKALNKIHERLLDCVRRTLTLEIVE